MNLKLEIDILHSFLNEFYSKYYMEYLGDINKKLPNSIDLNTNLENDLEFDFEAYDYFIGELSNRFGIDISDFYLNAHTRGMSFLFSFPLTKLLFPFIGLKKWMSFEKKERVSLCLGDILAAIQEKKLSSLTIFRNIERNCFQEISYNKLMSCRLVTKTEIQS